MGGRDYLAFREAIMGVMPELDKTFSFHELDYEAIGLDFGVMVRAKYSKGLALDYGGSVTHGANRLRRYLEDYARWCPNTKFVLGGYSQGAQVISLMLRDELETGVVRELSDKIIYAATIADPKLYLPEGLLSKACYTEARSDYRAYVPDCHAFMGILEGYDFSYIKDKELWQGKVGAWCNYHDFICSSRFDVDGFFEHGYKNFFYQHSQYAELGLYRDVAEKIYNKLAISYGYKEEPYSHKGTRDVAFVFDSTRSMAYGGRLGSFKNEAYRAAKKILEEGGRVALYEYRDLDDPFQTRKYCDFSNCTEEAFKEGLGKIYAFDGGDERESLLSALKTTLNGLSWNVGATKSIVVYTDAGFHAPDRDGTTLQEIIVKTKEIDPVHINVVATELAFYMFPELRSLPEQTGGKAYLSSLGEEVQATDDLINGEFDGDVFDDGSETGDGAVIQKIWAEMDGTSAKVKWEATNSLFYFVSIDGNPLGFVEGDEVEITDIDTESTVRILPYGTNGSTGEVAEISVGEGKRSTALPDYTLPLVPNTGVKRVFE